MPKDGIRRAMSVTRGSGVRMGVRKWIVCHVALDFMGIVHSFEDYTREESNL